MNRVILAWALGLTAIAFAPYAQGATPGILSYQGRVLVSNAPFAGPTGQFKFALVDATGANTFWTNDNTFVGAGSTEPTAAVTLNVANGLYSVLLGDTTIGGMTQQVPASVFTTNSDVRLRVWFNDGTNGSKQLSPDQRIAAVGFALGADTATNVNGGTINAARTSGSGNAGFFQTNNAGNGDETILATTNGTGRAGTFTISNAANISTALVAETFGSGPCLKLDQNGTGDIAYFVSNSVLKASIDKTGVISCEAVACQTATGVSGINSGSTAYALHVIDTSTGLAASFEQNGGAGQPIVNFVKNGGQVAFIASNGMYTTSDARLKTSIETLGSSLQKICSMRGVSFEWREANRNFSQTKNIGFIAQEVKSVIPEAVEMGKDGFYTVSYTSAIPVLVEAVKEQNSHIFDQQKVIDMQQQAIKALEARLTALEKAAGK